MNKQNLFWKLPELGALELQKATYRNHSFTPHFHEEYAIGVFLSGSQEKYYRQTKHIIPEGAICLINPGEVHSARSVDNNGWSYRMLYPSSTMVRAIATQITGKEQDYPFFPICS